MKISKPLYPLIFFAGKNSYVGLLTVAILGLISELINQIYSTIPLFVQSDLVCPPSTIADPSGKRAEVGYQRLELRRIRWNTRG